MGHAESNMSFWWTMAEVENASSIFVNLID